VKKIVIATNGSAAGRRVVARGLDLAGEQSAQAVVIRVVPARPTPTRNDWAPLEDAGALAAAKGIDVTTRILTGDPVNDAISYADSIDADLIVVGT
jgi:nucleotide-binding universal stress UspA family protein